MDTHHTDTTLVLQYDDQFPPLPTTVHAHAQQQPPKLAVAPPITNKTVTQTLIVPLAERKFGGANGPQKKVCQSVAAKCGVSIELSSGGRDQSLTVFINGHVDSVANAKRILAKELQTQTQIQHKVPKEFHKYVLGRNGTTLREIEGVSSTNITVPRPADNNDIVLIYGTKDGIERARYEIDQIVAERSKLATERLAIPKRFYPFILGPNNSRINQIRDTTNAKINIPPPTTDNDEIVVTGERENVRHAVDVLIKIFEETKKNCSCLNLPIQKSQHRYVYGTRGSGITEILEKTGVSVEMPPLESDDDTIVLFGPNESLAPALSLVIQKSESMLCNYLQAPNWLHRFIIGKQGVNLNKILDKYERVFINFQDESDQITVEGPKEDVQEITTQLQRQIDELKRTMAETEITVDPRFHRHIIGRNGSNIQRMQDEYRVQIRMPGNNATGQASWIIRIEGDPDGVAGCKSEIDSISVKLENEKTKDVILDHKFHSQLIGAHGSRIKDFRNQFPDVVITFPDLSSHSDIVQLRGPRQNVDQAAKLLQKVFQEVVEQNYSKDVRIFKQFHKNIIGKGGANIRRMREELNVRIDIPDEHSDNDVVRLTGKKAQVDEAAQRIEQMQEELITVKEEAVNIPQKLHNSLIGTRGKIIRCIQEECGGVQIQFPSSDVKSDTIRIRGPESDVVNAKHRLLELAEKNQLLSHTETVTARNEFHKFLIGRKGSRLAEFRQKHSVLVVFPDGEDTNKDTVQLIGSKEAVTRARADLEETIRSLENETEQTITVDQKWHRHFFRRRQAVMEEIHREFGGVRIFFPKQDAVDNGDKVRVVGARGCVEAAVVRIEDIVANLAAQTTVMVFIEQRHHRALLTRHMADIKAIQSDYDVSIKFPAKENSNMNNTNNIDGHIGEESVAGGEDQQQEIDEETNPANQVTISGRRDQCEMARDALLELVPISMDVPLASEFHRNLIGQKGAGINAFSSKYGVVVTIPQPNRSQDTIQIKGARRNIEEATLGLQELISQWQQERDDRIARSYELTMDVPVAFHRHIIGQRGSNIDTFRQRYSVQIQMPEQSSGSSTIVIRGYEADTLKAREELLATIRRLEAQVKEELHIPREVHPLLIGTRGFALRKLREQFHVDITFPGKACDPERANFVEVVGDKDDVDRCCDYLIERANELLDEFDEWQSVRDSNRQHHPIDTSSSSHSLTTKQHQQNNSPGFLVTGAPWQRVPDSKSNEDFPRMNGGGDKNANVATCLVNGHSE